MHTFMTDLPCRRKHEPTPAPKRIPTLLMDWKLAGITPPGPSPDLPVPEKPTPLPPEMPDPHQPLEAPPPLEHPIPVREPGTTYPPQAFRQSY